MHALIHDGTTTYGVELIPGKLEPKVTPHDDSLVKWLAGSAQLKTLHRWRARQLLCYYAYLLAQFLHADVVEIDLSGFEQFPDVS